MFYVSQRQAILSVESVFVFVFIERNLFLANAAGTNAGLQVQT
jgi:hypothetical protein